MQDETGWIEYISNLIDFLPTDFKDELREKAYNNYPKYGKPYLYLLNIIKDNNEFLAYFTCFSKEFVSEPSLEVLSLLPYDDSVIFTAFLSAIRRYGVFEKWIMKLIDSEIYFDSSWNNYFDLHDNRLTSQELDFIKEHREQIHPTLAYMFTP